MFKLFSKMPVIMLFIIMLIIGAGNKISLETAQNIYALSLTIKSFIIFILPFLIFSLLFKAAVHLAKDATKIILIILAGIIISNGITTSLANFVARWIYSFDMSLVKIQEYSGLEAASFYDFPTILPNNVALFAGIICGLLYAKFSKGEYMLVYRMEQAIQKVLTLITLLIPFFISGFFLKLYKDGTIFSVFKQYSTIVFIITLSSFAYIFLLFNIVRKFDIADTLFSIKQMFPAMVSAFSTMSSAATMPLTIIGVDSQTEKNDIANTVVPATVNVHLIGDCIAIPCFAFAILKHYGMPIPDFMTYMIFVFYFVIAKFSVAAVPGGGIIVMLPILNQYLGFNAEMMTLITALYILCDPIITSFNVLGNGAFAVIMDKILPADELDDIDKTLDEYEDELEDEFDEETNNNKN